ncbi:MAG: ABC transporter permease, partial [Treponema sp.]|nr:ABC transporter permease [Treponema sp.]
MTFIFRRIVISIITMFLVSLLCFCIFYVIRGDPALFLAGIDSTPEQLSALREELGLNKNLLMRYFDWLFKFLSGNPGSSFRFRGEAISTLIAERLPVTFTLAALSVFFIFII